MMLELRDELAARIAAALAPSSTAPHSIAARAYALADAMLLERFRAPLPDEVWLPEDVYAPREEDVELAEAMAEDPGPPHDAYWELEPRWALSDRARLQTRLEEHDGPGLATARPSAPPVDEEEDEARVG